MNGTVSNGHEVRPRSVADAPIDGLLERADELAKHWAMALLTARPLEEIDRVPLADIAGVAPSLCAHVLLALRSDDALELEEPQGGSSGCDPSGGRRDPLRLSWEEEPRALVAAVEALRGVLWDALERAAGAERLTARSERMLSDLADRLAAVCSVVLTRSLPAGTGTPAPAPQVRTDAAIGRETPPSARTAIAAEQGNRAQPSRHGPAGGQSRAASGEPARSGSSRVVLVDEFSEPARAVGAGRPFEPASTPAGTSRQAADADARPLPWDIPLDGAETPPELSAREAPRRRKADVPSISIIRKRRPRERE